MKTVGIMALIATLSPFSCGKVPTTPKKVPESVSVKENTPRWKRGDCVANKPAGLESWEKPTEEYKYIITEVGKEKYLMFVQYGKILTSLDMEFWLMDDPNTVEIECPKKFKNLSDYLHANPDAVLNYEGK